MTEDEILNSAHEHELKMAKVNKDRDIEVEIHRRFTAESRHQAFIWISVVVVVAATLFGAIFLGFKSAEGNRLTRQYIQEQAELVAESCIREGNIWYDGNCLIANKSEQ